MQLKLYNTLSKQKEIFNPIKTNRPSLYVCGPTVYSAPHLGNGLSVVVFDLLYRILCFIYGNSNVTYVRNITDVEDKINLEAKKRNITIKKLTSEIIKIFHNDAEQLGCLKPNIEPKVTDHINEIISMIEILISKNYAYYSDGHVYFEVEKYKDYGNLSGRKIDELIAGARVEVSNLKRNPADFVLWKPADEEDDPSSIFESPFGKGRPGWHIECSAMSSKYLGADFDIHGGGIDLIFPHHTNEIAQSCCANEGSKYAKFWVHNGFLTVEGEKMSKSLGNFITINDLLKSGIDGEIIRYHLLSTHYRKPMDWNRKSVDDAKKTLDSFYRVIQLANSSNQEFIDQKFIDALLDDLNTPEAYSVLHDIASSANKTSGAKQIELANKLKASANLIGLLNKNPNDWFTGKISIDTSYIEEQINLRNDAKKNKNFQLADEIRKNLSKHNITLEDKPDGTTIWRKS